MRVFTEPVRYVSVQAGVEDEAGEVDQLAVYNNDPKLKAPQMLPKGAVFAIKEPLYKTSSSGGYLVRVGKSSQTSPVRLLAVAQVINSI